MHKFNINLSDINAVYITHAHTDHVKGLIVFLKKTNITVYTRKKTLEVLLDKFGKDVALLNKIELINSPEHDFGELKVKFFRLPHKGWLYSGKDTTGETIGFCFEHLKKGSPKRLSFTTDCGHFTEGVKDIIKDCDAYVIEANYDHSSQLVSGRPFGLIKRNIGNEGHLSNDQAADYLLELVDRENTKYIFLAHLSEQCNTYEKAVGTVKRRLKDKFTKELPIISTDICCRHFV